MSIHPDMRIYDDRIDKWAALLIVGGITMLFIAAGAALGWVGVFCALGLILFLTGLMGSTEQGIKYKLGIHSTWCALKFNELQRRLNEVESYERNKPHE